MEGAIFSFGLWCNGNTTDSGPVFLGSNPSSPTFFIGKLIKKSASLMRGTLFLMYARHEY